METRATDPKALAHSPDPEIGLGSGILRWGGISPSTCLVARVPAGIPVELARDGRYRLDDGNAAVRLGVMVVPTGIGCAIGGWAGDASPYARLLASEFDWLVVNPNVVNGGAWQDTPDNALYVEGLALDMFLRGELALRPRLWGSNRIGVILPSEEAAWARERVALAAARTIWGLDILEPLQADDEAEMVAAGLRLRSRGAEALALVSHLEVVDPAAEASYLAGQGADPIGAQEAVRSHILTLATGLPCAHAPACQPADRDEYACDPRVAPEVASFSFLPSVLRGLRRAPALVQQGLVASDITVSALDAFVGPADCWLGASFLAAARHPRATCYAVSSNTCGIGLTPEHLGLGEVIRVSSYLELLGRLRASKLGITLP